MSDTDECPEPLYTYQQLLDWRGIAFGHACDRCSGSGSRVYASTATWHGGIGGAAMTNGVCDKCWGSGDRYRPWINLRMVDAMQRALKRIEGFAP